MKLSHRLLASILIGMTAIASSANAAIERADVTGGAVKGQVVSGVASFKGIPFAAPPVGELRWKKPQPVVAWGGVRNADRFAPACMQPWGEHETMRPSEDCLYLNVWTSAASSRERRPVVVWIHGGGLTSGMSSEKVSEGSRLASEGVVLVTIAYRLGAFGFLAHPELTRESGNASGNYGLFDMVAALKWVQANIERFGGDASRVTVVGGSAGAMAVSFLAVSPHAKGLYSRAAALGGGAFYPSVRDNPDQPFFFPRLKHGESQGVEIFNGIGAPNLQAARAVPAEKFVKATEGGAMRMGPVRDGDFIPGSNVELFQQGRFNDTPILIGYTSDEIGEPPGELTMASIKEDLEKAPCKHTHAAIVAAYPAVTSDEQARAIVRQVNRDRNNGWSIWTWARLQSTKGRGDAYVYFFDVHGADRPHGAPHATEYPYVFGNFPDTATAKDRAISDLIRKYLVNFAATGDPNGSGVPPWKKFDEVSQQAMVFDDASGSRPWPSLNGVKAMDGFLSCWMTQLDQEGERAR